MTLYSDVQIAEVAHEANRALMLVNGDPHASPRWGDLPDWWRSSALADIATARTCSAEQLHHEWRRRKKAAGWRWGPVRDEEAKTHPCITSYDRLPARERAKDVLYLAIINALDLCNYIPEPTD